MKNVFLNLLLVIFLALVAFLLLSSTGFLGEKADKTGKELTADINKKVNQGIDAIQGLVGMKKEEPKDKKKQAPVDPQAKFFKRLKTATPEEISDMYVQGFKPTKANFAGELPIVYMARYNNNIETYKLMFDLGANAEQVNKKGENALKVAVERGAPLELIRLLYANQDEQAKKRMDEKVKQGPGPRVISSYFPSIDKNAARTGPMRNPTYDRSYTKNKNLQGLE